MLIINELNNPEVSDPATGALPVPIPNPTDFSFFDVNGDGFISPIDALLVINELNGPSAALSSSVVVSNEFSGPTTGGDPLDGTLANLAFDDGREEREDADDLFSESALDELMGEGFFA